MPTHDDVCAVEWIVQYRSYYRKGQWLVKWRGYPEARNTWEPWENLLLDCCVEAKAEGKDCNIAHEHLTKARELEARERA